MFDDGRKDSPRLYSASEADHEVGSLHLTRRGKLASWQVGKSHEHTTRVHQLDCEDVTALEVESCSFLWIGFLVCAKSPTCKIQAPSNVALCRSCAFSYLYHQYVNTLAFCSPHGETRV